MIQLNDETYWLYAAVGPKTNELLHTTLEPTTTKVLAHSFLTELSEKYGVRESCFSSMAHTHSKTCVIATASISDTRNMKIGTPSNISLEN